MSSLTGAMDDMLRASSLRQQPEPASAILRRAREWIELGFSPEGALDRAGIIRAPSSRQLLALFWPKVDFEGRVEIRLRLFDLAIALAECAEGKRNRLSIAAGFGIPAWDIEEEINHRKRLLAKGTRPMTTVTITLPDCCSPEEYVAALLNASAQESMRGNTQASFALSQLAYYVSRASSANGSPWWTPFEVEEASRND